MPSDEQQVSGMARWTVRFDRSVGRFAYRIHRHLYQLTGGVVGQHSGMGPMLLLTTTGRRTGAQRTTPLLYMPEGEDFMVVASNGGRPEPPAWLLNLEAQPAATVQVGRRRVAARASVLPSDEHPELWDRMVASYRGWGEYQHLTDRRLKMVRLEPLG
jgi:deazaflavin-dependent oxidoreductase (nitroreductase family)